MVIGTVPSDGRALLQGGDTRPLFESTAPSRSVDMPLVEGLASAPFALTDDAPPSVRVFARRKLGEARRSIDHPLFISVEMVRQLRNISLKDASKELVRNSP
jgi:hypothetical protein